MSLGRGPVAPRPSSSAPWTARRAARRLAWAATASVVAHAALFYLPARTPPAMTRPVVALLVRTIALSATNDATSSRSVPPTQPSFEGVSTTDPPAAGSLRAGIAPQTTDRPAVATPPHGGRAPAAAPGGARSATDPAARTTAAAPVRPSGPVYHVAGELDPPPRPLQDIEPEYPPEAGYQPGTVVLRLYIDEAGSVDRVDVLQATPAGLFENAARSAFAAARFSPGRIAGVPVKCQLTIEVEFTPINRGGEVSGRTY